MNSPEKAQSQLSNPFPQREKNRDDFLHSIYVLRNAFRQSSTLSTVEISQLGLETGLQPYQISMWFDGERSQRDFWITQNGLPTPQNSRRFTHEPFNQGVASTSRLDSL
jgi:hypothetical protein